MLPNLFDFVFDEGICRIRVYFREAMSGVVLLDSFLCCRTVSVECAGEAGLVDEVD